MDNNNFNNGNYSAPGSDPNQYSQNQFDSFGGDINANNNVNNAGSYNGFSSGFSDPYTGSYDPNNQNGGANVYGDPSLNGFSDPNMYGTGYASDLPVDALGKPIPNNFGMKLAFSIVEIFFSLIFGVLALVFTCQQNTAYKERRWEEFKSKRKLSNIFLWIGLGISVISTVAIVIFLFSFFSVTSSSSSSSNNNYSYDYNYDDDDDKEDDDDDYFDYDDYDSYGDDDYDFGSYKDKKITLSATAESITINDVEYTFPMKASDFLSQSGIITEEDFNNYYVNKESSELLYFSDEYGCYNMVEVENTSDQQMLACDCVITAIKFEKDDYGDAYKAPVIDWRGLSIGSSVDDVLEVLGAPGDYDSYYVSDYDGSLNITYYAEDGGWIDVYFDENEEVEELWISLPGDY